MSRQTLNMTDALYAYLLQKGLREPPVLQELRHNTAGMELARMQIAPEQGQFMVFMVKLLGVRKIVEVGVFTGYSSLSMAMSMPDDGELVACDVNEEWTAMAREYWEKAGVAHKISLRLAPAKNTLEALLDEGQGESFDLAFIDADKAAYNDYYELCLQLLRKGGVIMLDNMLWGGSVADPDDDTEDAVAIRAMNDRIQRDQRVDMCLLPLADGLTMVRKLA